ncbi:MULTISPECIES: Rpn family recombination-promoting nuclease/putative transposase [unclassified Citrobacter]|uniref:Rpn family recombination-promoting nuclease/putative transposase n=1 Tax=unclassified Citrobacter TaxID=2644389 RepID=UPI002575DE61|nr:MULTISPECIES: Rpn family recombination-promoting nuclease/putative transposase [unclassified Citrobacter]MDM2970229.1 Rpn family recombination-promoting nuclease/putative transposase [Citrobacter sp. CK199]MDM2978803.1 Rpn family recombination-promoting nuclease/putative transposase [Citrobacter sp. CK200]
MERLSTTPHDAVFRQLLTQKAIARDFLQIHLPDTFLRICNLDSLTLESGSFVEDNLRASYSDILYSLQTTHGPGYVYALIEHQSKPDKFMAFRLMRYAIAAMQRHLDAGHDTLPLVVPLLFYHGSISPWPYSLNWQNMFCEPALANSLYSNEFALVDLTVMPDNQIMRHRRMAMLELLQKHIRRRDLAELQDQLITLLTQEHLTRSQISVLIHYMLQVGNTTDPGALIRKLASSAPQYKEQLMSIAEWLEEKGRADGLQKGMQQGMQQGRQKGLEEGRQAEARSIALKMLNSGLAPDLITHLTGLSPEELSALSH